MRPSEIVAFGVSILRSVEGKLESGADAGQSANVHNSVLTAGRSREILQWIGTVDKPLGRRLAGELVGARARKAKTRHVDHTRIENSPPFDGGELGMGIILFRSKRHRPTAKTTAAERFHIVRFV